jgi:hypothetical protein
MYVVVGLLAGLGIVCWIAYAIRGLFRVGTRAVTREVDIARGKTPATTAEVRAARPVPRGSHRRMSRAEREYLAAHVPASSGTPRLNKH